MGMIRSRDFSGFKRDVQIGPYVADWLCHAAKLVIDKDAASPARQRWFAARGYLVLAATEADPAGPLVAALVRRRRWRCH